MFVAYGGLLLDLDAALQDITRQLGSGYLAALQKAHSVHLFLPVVKIDCRLRGYVFSAIYINIRLMLLAGENDESAV